MRLKPTTSLNDAIKRMAYGHAGAASVIALLVKEFPERVMDYLHAMDRLGIYGSDIWNTYQSKCDGSAAVFLTLISGKKS